MLHIVLGMCSMRVWVQYNGICIRKMLQERDETQYGKQAHCCSGVLNPKTKSHDIHFTVREGAKVEERR